MSPLSNDPSSATAATRRADCNRDGPPPFAAAHGGVIVMQQTQKLLNCCAPVNWQRELPAFGERPAWLETGATQQPLNAGQLGTRRHNETNLVALLVTKVSLCCQAARTLAAHVTAAMKHRR